MKKRKLSTRILIPITLVTIVFAVAIFVLGSMTLNRLIEDSLDNKLAAAKVVDIENRQQQIAEKALAEAALFGQAEAVL
ncbi:MAG TPA: hypothetical protein ENN66_01070 [Proteobacteria bacterium]|nr:hypothetical protein [Pseudomonadota bacterium]